jgi:thimet oligopeptidase
MLFDYEKVTAASVTEVVDRAIATGDALLDEVAAQTGERTFADTIAPFDRVAVLAAETYGQGPFMARVHPEKAVRDAASTAEAELEQWMSSIDFRRDLYEAVEAYAATDEAAGLTGEQARLLEHLRRDFRRAGHELDAEARAEVERLRSRLIELGVTFSRNIDAYEDGLELTREELEGLPDSYVDRLAPGEAEGTYRVSLDYPDYFPFSEQAARRDLREALAFKFANAAREDNTPLLEEAVGIRRRIAELFGLDSWAHYGMEVKMARTPEAVADFYDALVPPLQAQGRRRARRPPRRPTTTTWSAGTSATCTPGSSASASASTRTRSPSTSRCRQVLDGMFAITSEVFGLTYAALDDAPVWHPDVTAWRIDDTATGETLAHFYLDLHPREGKFGHAAVFPLGPGRATDDGYTTPVSAMVANFTKPTPSSPSLLQHEEVTTLFHEFGHILHNSLGHTRFARFSGTSVEWDFVEAPSQIMEHWCWTPHVLQRFAHHHETGEPIPVELVEQLVAARDLHVALLTLRQIELGQIDLAYHGPSRSATSSRHGRGHGARRLPAAAPRDVLLGQLGPPVRLRRRREAGPQPRHGDRPVTEAAALAAARWQGLGATRRPATRPPSTRCARSSTPSRWTAPSSSARARRTRRPCSTTASRRHRQPPEVDIAVDPIDGTRLLAEGRPGSLAVIAAAPAGTMFDPGPCVYMEKLVVGPRRPDAVDLDRPLGENLAPSPRPRAARCATSRSSCSTATGTRRPSGRSARPARGSSSSPTATSPAGSSPRGTSAPRSTCSTASAAPRRGSSRPAPSRRSAGAPRSAVAAQRRGAQAAVDAGYDLDQVLTADDLVAEDCFFACTGITPGQLVSGVRPSDGNGAITQTLVMRSKSGTVRLITARVTASRSCASTPRSPTDRPRRRRRPPSPRARPASARRRSPPSGRLRSASPAPRAVPAGRRGAGEDRTDRASDTRA